MNRSFALAAPLACVALLTAQEPASQRSAPAAATLAAVRTPIHTQADDHGVPYGVWAAGAGYKVSFHDGMRFVPYTGRGAQVSVGWRTASARVGALELATAEQPALRYSPWRAEYDLGSVVEAYDVRADGVEQTFVLARRPASSGDLIIRGAIDSVLSARAGADRGAVDFADDAGRVLVRYGAAIAIDANGDRCDLTTTVVDGGVELRLAGAWLESAAFPLVVDPLVSPVTVASGAVVTEVDVAHDRFGTMNVWYAEVRTAGGDEDLRLLRTDENGLNPVVVFEDLSNNWSAREPSLGVHRPSAKVLLAYVRDYWTTSDSTRVKLHLHGRADTTFDGSVINVPDVAGVNQWRPAVGHDLAPVSNSSLLVAYQIEAGGAFTNIADSRIEGITVSVLGGGSVIDQFPIAGAAGIDFERPTIAKVGAGPTCVYTVGYQKYVNVWLGSDWDVCLRRVDGNVVGAEFVVDGADPRHEMAPQLTGIENRLMLFYTASTTAELPGKPMGANGHRIRGTRVEWFGGAFTTPYGSNELQTNNDPRLELAGADFDQDANSIWGLAFRSTATETVYFRTYGYTGNQLSTDTVESPSVALGTSVGGGVAFQANDDEFLIAYGMTNPPASSQARLCRRDYPSVLGITNTGTGCTTTQLSWSGSRWIGTYACGVNFSQAPANSFTAIVVATAPASLQLFGIGGVHDGCWLLTPLSGPDHVGILGPMVSSSGFFQIPLPEYLSPVTLRFQAVTWDPATSEFYSSDRLNVPIAK